LKFTAKAIAIAAALSAAAIATPAMASTQPAALTGSGNLCVHDKVNKLNFCLNVLGAGAKELEHGNHGCQNPPCRTW
jgi:hypothetical protein